MRSTPVRSLVAAAVLAASAAAQAAPVPVFNFPDPAGFAVQYGDFYSFSMPILSSAVQGYTVASVNYGPGSAYYINTANVIQDALVVGTGSGGNQNNQDLGLAGWVQDGFDFPNAGGNSLISFDTMTAAQPGPGGGGAMDQAGTWDVSLAALRDYLTIGGVQYDLIGYFNNNQQNRTAEANNLWARAEITLRDTDTGALSTTLLFRDPTSANADYVLSGGPVTLCFDDNLDGTRTTVSCAGPHDSESTYEHNLGQNAVAYGLSSAVLNAILLDHSSAYDTLSIRVQFEGLNNGFENLYLGAACINRQCGQIIDVPEPGILALLAAGLLAAGLGGRRARRR